MNPSSTIPDITYRLRTNVVCLSKKDCAAVSSNPSRLGLGLALTIYINRLTFEQYCARMGFGKFILCHGREPRFLRARRQFFKGERISIIRNIRVKVQQHRAMMVLVTERSLIFVSKAKRRLYYLLASAKWMLFPSCKSSKNRICGGRYRSSVTRPRRD